MVLIDCLRRHGVQPRGIVHAGAHCAEEMDLYLGLGPALVVWIEADPALLPAIEARIAARAGNPTRQIAIQALITDRDGVATDFHRFSNDGASSSVFRDTPLLRETWPGLHRTGEVLSLPSSRLDTALRAHGVTPDHVDTLALDLQGAELLALRGSGAFLDQVEFLEAELSQERFYDGGAQADELAAFLAAHGFERITELHRHGDTVFRAPGHAPRARARAALQAEIDALLRSRSWRMTAPLRLAARVLRRAAKAVPN
jgi:FkbM family methyltransferase